MISRLLYRIRWWKWFLLDHPSPFVQLPPGSAKPLEPIDPESYEIMQRRWKVKEPKPDFGEQKGRE
jgi:hypothetical protein